MPQLLGCPGAVAPPTVPHRANPTSRSVPPVAACPGMESNTDDGADRRPQAESLFAAYLERLERGDGADFDALCSAHRHYESELRQLHSDYQDLHDLQDQAEVAGSLHLRIAALFGQEVDPRITIDSEGRAEVDSGSTLLAPLVDQNGTSSRYRVNGELGRGGMGVVLRAWDGDLRRQLAMKVALPERADTGLPSSSRVHRFLKEAQITSQLDHPGIVPVHELGLDEHGRVYFTMKLVQGHDLAEVFSWVCRGKDGWTQIRAVNVLLRVSEAMSYAHDKGVLHRDLKPSNVMVGDYGAVYVMDWGLARVLDGDTGGEPEIQTLRADDGTDASPVLTVEGDVLGTPVYMSPEQARGHAHTLGPRSDVYSVGAMLYHLLSGAPPHLSRRDPPNSKAILERVRQGALEPVRTLAPDAPPELIAICEKAMAFSEAERYASMQGLAEDLRAYTEGRVVRAYEQGPVAELRKWIGRNRALAGAAAAAVLFLVLGVLFSSLLAVRFSNEADDVKSLSAIQDHANLVRRADALWPPTPDRIPDYEAWLADAEALVEERDAHVDKQAQIAVRGVEREGALAFDDLTDEWWWTQLGLLLGLLDELEDSDRGQIFGTSPAHGWGVARRLAFARELDAGDWSSEWATAIDTIADTTLSPAYGGARIKPQADLVPLGPDPDSGLWEFAHLMSGTPPPRDADTGALRIDAEAGVVLVLVPDGTVTLGSQKENPDGLRYYWDAHPQEAPLNDVTLDSFFISKYELTQSQWERLTGTNPSRYGPGMDPGNGRRITSLHPVEGVSWLDVHRVLVWCGLTLPTEAQWEYAARAGSDWTFLQSDDPTSMKGYVNIADITGIRHNPHWPMSNDWLDDGYVVHAPVDALLPNAFGLHNVLGNVWEWCEDFRGDYSAPILDRAGRRDGPDGDLKAARGGAYMNHERHARLSIRDARSASLDSSYHGVRPARPLAP